MVQNSSSTPPPPAALLRDIERLKQLLQAAPLSGSAAPAGGWDAFADRFWQIFWGRIASAPAYVEASYSADNPQLTSMAERIVSAGLGRGYSTRVAVYLYLPSVGFWQGCCVLARQRGDRRGGRSSSEQREDKLILVVYFDDIVAGLLTLLGDFGGERSRLARFSGRALAEGRVPELIEVVTAPAGQPGSVVGPGPVGGPGPVTSADAGASVDEKHPAAASSQPREPGDEES
ncbi:hypothetical protein [Haliangium ochraceum]|uniref:Uncharacterized protein n=1 Tax=Haliangium ochraceum (strain DSM 14365 / JCM 11303 / SMP-2) TaxID=502025 RepID=D0LRU9_HALO1|nr:hypothetical protein [Haliangium ochraceum]ACY19091.1 hypothetical protein Hoch_6625 [Haliangium ochraceum DSM 14365]